MTAAIGQAEPLAGHPPPEEIVALAADLLDELPRVTDRLVGEILGADPVYRAAGLVPLDEVRRSCHDNLSAITQSIVRFAHPPPARLDPPRRTGVRRAEQGLPLDSLLRAYRLGGRVLWQSLAAQTRRRGDVDPAALVDGATVVWQLVDEYSDTVAEAFRVARLELTRDAPQRRDALFDALLERTEGDVDTVWAAADALRLPLVDRLTVVAAESRPDVDGIDRAPALLAASRLRSAWRRRDDVQVGIVALGDRPLEAVRVALAPAVTARVGVSPVFGRLCRASTALGEARMAVDTLRPGTARVVTLDERLPAALLQSAPALGGRLVRRTLGPLLAVTADERDVLLDTVRTWIAHRGSAGAAASVLFCHRNTVLNRLRRVAELTGYDVTVPEDLVQVALALDAFDQDLPTDHR